MMISGRQVLLGLLLIFALQSCTRSDDKGGAIARGQALLAEGKYEEASIQFRKLLQAQPNSADLHYHLGLARLKQGKRSTAFWLFRRALEFDPKHAGAKAQTTEIALSGLLLQPGASSDLRDLLVSTASQLELGNDKFQASRIRGYLAMVNGQQTEAIEFFSKALALQPKSAEIGFALAQNLILAGREKEGETAALRLIELQSDYAPAYDTLYGLYRRTRRDADGLLILERKVATAPKNPLFLTQLMEHHTRTGNTEKLEQTVQRLLGAEDGALHAGDFYRSLGQHQKAIEYYDRGPSSPGGDKRPFSRRRALALADLGKTEEAIALLRTLANDRADLESRSLLALALIRNGTKKEIDEAIVSLEDLVRTSPEDNELRTNLAGAYIARGDIEKGQRLFLDIWHRDPTQAKPLMALAEVAIQTKQFANARRYSGQWLNLEPLQPKARLIHATSFVGEGNLDQAAKELDELIKSNPEYLEAKLQRALLFALSGKFNEGEARLRKLYKPGSSDLRALKGLVEIQRMQRHYDVAFRLADEEFRRNVDSGVLLNLRAETAAEAGKPAVAVESYRKLLERFPGNWRTQYRLGRLLLDRQIDRNEAAELLAKAYEVSNDLDTGLALAEALDSSNRHAEAAAVYDKMLLGNPDNPALLNNAAFRMAELGVDLDRALAYAQKASERAPNSSEVADTLGWVYLKKGMNPSAVQVFQTLVKREPANSSFHYHLGLGYLQGGNREKALLELKKALDLKPAASEEAGIRQALGLPRS